MSIAAMSDSSMEAIARRALVRQERTGGARGTADDFRSRKTVRSSSLKTSPSRADSVQETFRITSAEMMLEKQAQENLEIRHMLVLAENQGQHVVIRSAEAMAVHERTHDLQRNLILAETRARQPASVINDVLVQSEYRAQSAEELTGQFAIESVNMYQHALLNACRCGAGGGGDG
jgi:hypothetical protein